METSPKLSALLNAGPRCAKRFIPHGGLTTRLSSSACCLMGMLSDMLTLYVSLFDTKAPCLAFSRKGARNATWPCVTEVVDVVISSAARDCCIWNSSNKGEKWSEFTAIHLDSKLKCFKAIKPLRQHPVQTHLVESCAYERKNCELCKIHLIEIIDMTRKSSTITSKLGDEHLTTEGSQLLALTPSQFVSNKTVFFPTTAPTILPTLSPTGILFPEITDAPVVATPSNNRTARNVITIKSPAPSSTPTPTPTSKPTPAPTDESAKVKTNWYSKTGAFWSGTSGGDGGDGGDGDDDVSSSPGDDDNDGSGSVDNDK